MPKLNVQQNNQNVIQAFKNALAIGNLKGIIASDGNHNFSAAGSNRNLLDNQFFTINQRGFAGGSTAGYTVDRWKNDNGSAITFSDGVIGLPANTVFIQPIEPDLYAELVGKTVTLSVLYSDNTIASGTITVPSSGSTYATGTPRLAMNGTNKRFFCYPSTSISVKAFKLELGSVSTLANDAPPDYEEELLKCQRYFIRINAETAYGVIGTAYISAANNALMLLNINMRARPTTVTTSGTFRIMANGTSYSGVVLTADKDVSNSRVLRFSCYRSAAGLTIGQAALITADNNAASYIDISADL